MDYPRLSYQDFVTIYHKVPRATIDIVVETNRGIVLSKRSIEPFRGMWHIPGGTILFKEPIEHAINRISQEELGVSVKIIRHLGINEFFDDGGKHAVCNVFLVHIIDGELRGSDQGEEICFINNTVDNMIPEQKAFLEKYYYKG